jgi:predicted NAD-dependent protein-ADP-ribosyltransferase YbiA (DUF1768 family)
MSLSPYGCNYIFFTVKCPIFQWKRCNTNPKNLYEASPYNKIWGTGYDALNTLRLINENSQNMLGTNLLGKALEEIRQEFLI